MPQITWTAVSESLPPDRRFVMVTGDSGYTTTRNFLTLARLDKEFRPPINGRLRWLGINNDDLSDCGWRPTHWAEPINLPGAS